jgi:long-chain acyl-CoA synthetase
MVMADELSSGQAALQGMTVAYHAQQYPERTAVVSPLGNRSFGALNSKANQLARALRQSGLQPNDSVAMLLVNRPEFLEVYYACLRAGFRITPINWHLTGDNASYIVANCEAKAFIADIRCAESAIEALHTNHQQLRLAACVGGDLDGFVSYESVLAGQAETNIDNPELGSQMLYTSGTTGRPKGVFRERVTLTTTNSRPADTVTAVSVAAAWNPQTDMALCTGPAYHAAPLAFNIIAPIANGVGTVLMDKWSPEETLRLITEYKITHTHMVATMFHRLLALPRQLRDQFELTSLRFILHGAAPCPVHVKESMMQWLGLVLYEYYAATEGGGGFFVGPQEWLQKPGTVGKTPPQADNRILDDDGNILSAGKMGTIYFKAPALRFEYFKDADKTAGSYRGDYFTLGDMGYLDEDGYLFLTGRSAETIISGGVNIYPQETDDVMLRHPAVADVCTIGIPSEEWGEEVKSVVMLKQDSIASEAMARELIAFSKDHLPGFKSPRTIDFVDDLPRLPSGKIQRKVVRAPFWAGREKQI